jgi:hypothetical protein
MWSAFYGQGDWAFYPAHRGCFFGYSTGVVRAASRLPDSGVDGDEHRESRRTQFPHGLEVWFGSWIPVDADYRPLLSFAISLNNPNQLHNNKSSHRAY